MAPYIGWLLYFALCVYNGLDAYQTKLLFDLGCEEANPLMAYFIEVYGTWLVIIAWKALILVILGGFLFVHQQQRRNLNVINVQK